MGFPKTVNAQQAPAIPGDFGDANVRANILAGAGALVAGVTGREPIIGNFAWADQLNGVVNSSFRGELAAKLGFVARQQGLTLISTYLSERRLSIVPGNMTTLFNQGSFFVEFTAGASVGQKVFARFVDGSVYAAAAGTTTQTASAMTGSVSAGGVLTVSALTGTIGVGDVLSLGLMPAGGSAVLSQISGTPGGIGTYQLSVAAAAANLTSVVANSAVETTFYVDTPAAADAAFTGVLSAAGVLTVSSISGAMAVGQTVAGTGVSPNVVILSQLTGSAGSNGTYQTNATQGPALTSRAMTASQGQLAKISTWG